MKIDPLSFGVELNTIVIFNIFVTNFHALVQPRIKVTSPQIILHKK